MADEPEIPEDMDEDEYRIYKWRLGVRAGEFVTWDDPRMDQPPE